MRTLEELGERRLGRISVLTHVKYGVRSLVQCFTTASLSLLLDFEGGLMIVQVTQEDIKEGLKQDPFRCPVARALSRVFGERVLVSGIYDGTRTLYYKIADERSKQLPQPIADWIYSFDQGYTVQPFSFEI